MQEVGGSEQNIRGLIQARWREEQCPIIDGVLYDDGRIFVFEYDLDPERPQMVRSVAIERETSLAEILERDPNAWTFVTELDEQVLEQERMRIICGEGGFGSDGFVAATCLEDGALRWIAFSQRSNPFLRLSFDAGRITAVSSLEIAWTYPIDEPHRVVIEPATS